jgi:hypothetical protein
LHVIVIYLSQIYCDVVLLQAEELRAKKLAKRAAWDAGFAQGGGAAAAAAAAAVDRGLDPAAAADGSDDEEGAEGDGAGGV